MTKINIHIDPRIINKVYRPYLNDGLPVQIFYGGSSSGKSYFLAQRCIIDMLNGHNYLIVRKVARTLRKSTFNEIQKAISAFHVSSLFKVNISEMVITAPNGYQILFAGADDPEKIKSITPAKGVIDTIWMEEATEFAYEDYKQLQKRLRGTSRFVKRIVLSFNPIYQTHWIYREFFSRHWTEDSKEFHSQKLRIVKTTYRDNSFLTQDDIDALESEKDPYWRSVYCDGNWGALGHIIFKNWSAEDLSGREWETYENGLDFGYANDPTAIVRCHYDRDQNILYIKNARYLYGYTNDLIAAELQNNFLSPHDIIICDSAEPKSIQELKQYGINAIPAEKGPDSVNFGIQWLQRLTIIVDSSLMEMINELSVYKWQEDKEGNALPKPEDKNNHLVDALRYSLGREMRDSGYRNRNSIKNWPRLGAI